MLGEYSTSGLFMEPIEYKNYETFFESEINPLSKLTDELKRYHNSKDIILFNSGFWALVIAIKSKLDKSESKVVLLPSLTYRRLADAVYWAGGIPCFCDVEEETLALDKNFIFDYLKKNNSVGAIILVQPIVGSVDIDDYLIISENFSVPLIVDSVESVHDTINKKKCGSFDVPEVFSLHASKFINGFEGGYLSISQNKDKVYIKKIIESLGPNNFKLNPFHATIAYHNLKYLDKFIDHNKLVYQTYKREFNKIKLEKIGNILDFPKNDISGFKNIVLQLSDEFNVAESLVNYLNSKGIYCRMHYSPALHRKNYSYKTLCPSTLHVTEKLEAKLVNLPCGWRFQATKVQHICDMIVKFFNA